MKSVILLSGGLDSAVALKHAVGAGSVLCALTFNYGQRAARREVAAARAMCRRLGIRHHVIRLDWLRAITSTALVNPARPVPQFRPADLANSTLTQRTARAVWVPNRNGVFVMIAAAFAEALGADTIIAGFNAEEGVTFPDNRAEFVTAMNRALRLSTMSKVKLVAPTQRLDKVQIVRLGRRIGAPIDLVWSCYHGGRKPCGRCESCQRLLRATLIRD